MTVNNKKQSWMKEVKALQMRCMLRQTKHATIHPPHHLQQLKPRSNQTSHQSESQKEPYNPKKPSQPIHMLPGNLNIHPKKPRDKMQRHENRRQHRNPTHDRRDIITQP